MPIKPVQLLSYTNIKPADTGRALYLLGGIGAIECFDAIGLQNV